MLEPSQKRHLNDYLARQYHWEEWRQAQKRKDQKRRIEIIGDSIHDPRVNESYLKCRECRGRLEHKLKPDWLGRGKWQVFAPNANPDFRSFAINQLYSFTVSPGIAVTTASRKLQSASQTPSFVSSIFVTVSVAA